MGTFSAKDRRTYQNICHLTERGVLSIMRDILERKYGKDKVTATPSFVYAFGEIPIALVAHADTVFKLPPSIEHFYYDSEKDVIWNPEGAGADDRAGIFAIILLLKRFKFKPHVIITTGEESGCIGAGKLIAHMPVFKEPLKFMIQLDRRNRNDAVYYDCDNLEFEKFITPFGFHTEWGTFTDISVLAPVWGVAAVNFSIGYEDEHHEIERLHVDWMYETIEKTAKILQYVEQHPEMEPFKYIPAYDSYTFGTNRYKYYSDGWYLDDDELDDWYIPDGYKPKPGFAHCDWCHREVPETQVIPVKMEHGITPMNMCLSCHDKVAHQVVWCRNCGNGYYLNQHRIKDVDIKNYICEDCKDGLQQHSKPVQSSDKILSGLSGSDQHGSSVPTVGETKEVVPGQHRVIDL